MYCSLVLLPFLPLAAMAVEAVQPPHPICYANVDNLRNSLENRYGGGLQEWKLAADGKAVLELWIAQRTWIITARVVDGSACIIGYGLLRNPPGEPT